MRGQVHPGIAGTPDETALPARGPRPVSVRRWSARLWSVDGANVLAVLVGIGLWCAHFGRATHWDGSPLPPMSAPFEIMLGMGRVLSLAVLALALLGLGLAALTRHGGVLRIRSLRGATGWLLALNLFLILKQGVYAGPVFLAQGGAILILSVGILSVGMAGIEARSFRSASPGPSRVALACCTAGLLIVATNLAALVLHPEIAVNLVGRMHGTTVNPQHLAMMCALAVPSYVYVIARSGAVSVPGILCGLAVAATFYLQFQTGSRMGFFASALGLVLAARALVSGRYAVLPMVLALPIVLPLLFLLVPGNDLQEQLVGRFIENREDTRTEYWRIAWSGFLDNPVLGVPPDETGRLQYALNFLLAAAAAGGVAGLFMGLMITLRLVFSMLSLALTRKRRYDPACSAFYAATLAIYLFVCLFEAALLGIMTTPTMMAYMVFSGAMAYSVWAGRWARARQGPS